jgi:hypothetical protein
VGLKVVEPLPSKQKVLSSDPSAAKQRQKSNPTEKANLKLGQLHQIFGLYRVLCHLELYILDHFKDVFTFRKDPHGFFAFPVTDAIAPGYSMIIKHPMDFGTMKDKIAANEYKSVTEFKVHEFCFLK